MFCVARIFGPVFSLGVPLRVLHSNFINCVASLRAVWRYSQARIQQKQLVWLKTEHAYPAHEALQSHRRELADVLVRSGYLSESELSNLKAKMPAGVDLADFLLASGALSGEDLCQAISLQSGLPSTRIDTRRVKPRVVRSLPVHVQERFGVVPFRVHGGRLLVAGTRPPDSGALEQLKDFSQLPIEFQLVTHENYKALRELV
jgi:adsorption protein B